MPRILKSFKLRLFFIILLIGLVSVLLFRWGILRIYENQIEAYLSGITDGSSNEKVSEMINEMARVLNLFSLAVLAVIAGVGAVVSFLSVKPFEEIAKQVSEVASFEDEVEVKAVYQETEEIVSAFHKLQDRLKTIDASRQEFVSNVSHELKTPLTSMKVLADSLMVMEDAPVEMYKEFMTDIASEIDRETETINDLMSLARMDEGAGALHIKQVDMEQLLEAIVKELRYIAKEKDIDLIIETNRPVTAEVDAIKMTQAFRNLIENAIKYNKRSGYVKMILDANHQNATVQVEDSGLGIKESDIDQIFERFYRGDKSHSTQIEGSGLGLSITKKIILLHKGSISVKSVLGEGSTFSVVIPLKNSVVSE